MKVEVKITDLSGYNNPFSVFLVTHGADEKEYLQCRVSLWGHWGRKLGISNNGYYFLDFNDEEGMKITIKRDQVGLITMTDELGYPALFWSLWGGAKKNGKWEVENWMIENDCFGYLKAEKNERRTN